MYWKISKDVGERIPGRKLHLVVDTLGLVMAVVVHAANIQDPDGAKMVSRKLAGPFSRLALIWADRGYAGKLIDWVEGFGSDCYDRFYDSSAETMVIELFIHFLVLQRYFQVLHRKTCDNAQKKMVHASQIAEMPL